MKQKHRFKILSALIAVFLLLLAFLPLEYACIDASDWMADLDDAQPLSALTIPGTHDSGALYSIADVAGKCQSLTVREQLKAGVRFFDIRLQLRGDKLAVVHSFVDQMTDFVDVLDDMTNFLHDHPTEFLLVSIKQDADPKNPTTTFAKAVEQMLSAYPDLVRADRTLPETVADARGTMTVLARYADAEVGVPAYDGWQDNTSFSLGELYVQDHYAIDDLNDKQMDIADAFAVAAEPSHALTLNYLSCYLTHGFPPLYAATPAKTLLGWLETYLSDHAEIRGVIICDFMTSALCEQIWRCNFQ